MNRVASHLSCYPVKDYFSHRKIFAHTFSGRIWRPGSQVIALANQALFWIYWPECHLHDFCLPCFVLVSRRRSQWSFIFFLCTNSLLGYATQRGWNYTAWEEARRLSTTSALHSQRTRLWGLLQTVPSP